MSKNNSGFSLAELSVVIVIIGLMIGGIVTASGVINNSKMRVVIKEITEYRKATESFKEKFKYYPGDFNEADGYWGATDGNGNWQIGTGAADVGDTANMLGEPLQFWRHLFLSNIIIDPLTGADAGTPDYIAGVNVPKSVINNSFYYAFYHADIFNVAGNAIYFNSMLANNVQPWGASISPRDASSIDSKIDDGTANTGEMFASDGDGLAAGSCSAAIDDGIGADYNLSQSDDTCQIIYWLNKE